MHAEVPNHEPSLMLMNCGDGRLPRPSFGAWVTYGLGSENENLPAYVVLDGGLTPPGGLDNFKNGFLPATYQASILKAREIPLANIVPREKTKNSQQAKLTHMKRMDQSLLGKLGHTDQIESAIANYELAYRMQSAVPELTEFKDESRATMNLYGMFSPDKHTQGYAAQCLLARRLVERGVRFIELTCPKVEADRWDQHSQLEQGHINNAVAVDRPIAGLIHDLKSRGLLDTTIVLWGGEFGRTPSTQGSTGRDRNPFGYTVFLAGGGFRPGYHHGATDDFGYYGVDGKVHINDLHATMLHLMGLDHERLTFEHHGRPFRLTDVAGKVVKEIIA